MMLRLGSRNCCGGRLDVTSRPLDAGDDEAAATEGAGDTSIGTSPEASLLLLGWLLLVLLL
jgi:hypothetical protein